jgi:hypothetical protein
VKYPIRPVPVEYHRYWPTKWYGEPGTIPAPPTGRQFPVVFTPTDTTQLGYYYQRVPTWRPKPEMIPPGPPWPPEWHHRENCNPGVDWRAAVGPVGPPQVIPRAEPQPAIDLPEPPAAKPVENHKEGEAQIIEPPPANDAQPNNG